MGDRERSNTPADLGHDRRLWLVREFSAHRGAVGRQVIAAQPLRCADRSALQSAASMKPPDR
jgi:hypothetical protein